MPARAREIYASSGNFRYIPRARAASYLERKEVPIALMNRSMKLNLRDLTFHGDLESLEFIRAKRFLNKHQRLVRAEIAKKITEQAGKQATPIKKKRNREENEAYPKYSQILIK